MLLRRVNEQVITRNWTAETQPQPDIRFEGLYVGFWRKADTKACLSNSPTWLADFGSILIGLAFRSR